MSRYLISSELKIDRLDMLLHWRYAQQRRVQLATDFFQIGAAGKLPLYFRTTAQSMMPYAIAAIAGMLCLPATYGLTRWGSFLISIAIVLAIGSIGGILAMYALDRTKKRTTLWILGAFVAGALLCEMYYFAQYYFNYGYEDPKLGVGIFIMMIELGVIAVLGGGAFFIAARIYGHRAKQFLDSQKMKPSSE